jgi:hypothetical protein
VRQFRGWLLVMIAVMPCTSGLHNCRCSSLSRGEMVLRVWTMWYGRERGEIVAKKKHTSVREEV